MLLAITLQQKIKRLFFNQTGFLVKMYYVKHFWMTTNELSIRHILRSMLRKKKARYLVVCYFEQMCQSFWTVQEQKYEWNRDITEKSHVFPLKIFISLLGDSFFQGMQLYGWKLVSYVQWSEEL